jgi:glycosyltransferase involved in cell wall biosynthesis
MAKKSMRILLLSENTGFGGINTYVLTMAEGLRREGIQADIAAVWPKPDNWLGEKGLECGLPCAVLAKKRSVLQFPGVVRELAGATRKQQYDIVHTQGHYSGLVGRAASLLAREKGNAKLVATCHGIVDQDYRLGLNLFFWLNWRTFHMNHAIIAVSQDTKLRIKEKVYKPVNIEVILHGILSQVDADKIRKYSSAKKDNETPQLLFVGRLSPEKGCATLIEAADILKDRGNRFQLIIVGDGPERSSLAKRVAAAGLGAQVTFAGWKLDVRPFYETADIVAVPSLRESIGLVILEAMLHGGAIVATAVQGIPEIVQEGQTGLLVSSQDPGELALALERLLKDCELRNRLSQAGKLYVTAHHTIERMVAQTIEVYQQALRAYGGGRHWKARIY